MELVLDGFKPEYSITSLGIEYSGTGSGHCNVNLTAVYSLSNSKFMQLLKTKKLLPGIYCIVELEAGWWTRGIHGVENTYRAYTSIIAYSKKYNLWFKTTLKNVVPEEMKFDINEFKKLGMYTHGTGRAWTPRPHNWI